MSVVPQWQSTGGSNQRPWVRSPVAPHFFLCLCRFKGLRTVTAPIVFNYTVTIGLWTLGGSHPSESPCCDYAHNPLSSYYCMIVNIVKEAYGVLWSIYRYIQAYILEKRSPAHENKWRTTARSANRRLK